MENQQNSQYSDFVIQKDKTGDKVVFDTGKKEDKIKFVKAIRWEIMTYYSLSHLARDVLQTIWLITGGGFNTTSCTNSEFGYMTGRTKSKISQGLQELEAIGLIYKTNKRKSVGSGKYANQRTISVNREMLIQIPLAAYQKILNEFELAEELQAGKKIYYFPATMGNASERDKEKFKVNMIKAGLWEEGGIYR